VDQSDLDHWDDSIEKTRPGKITNLTPELLQFYYDYFSEIRPVLVGRMQIYTDLAHSRMEQLQIEMNRVDQFLRDETIDQTSENRHSETRKLTRWAIGIAAIGAVATIVFGIFGVLQKRADKQTSTPAPSLSDIQLPTSPLPRTSRSQTKPAPTAMPAQSPLLSSTPAR
jgi:hypothetical protein